MAPTIYSFDGIKIVLYPEDHIPVHFHAQYAEFETVYELNFDNGKLIKIETRATSNQPLPIKVHKKVLKFIKKYHKHFLLKWTDLIILKKRVHLTKINDI